MITEQDLQAAIAECKGERDPNANTCIKLAAYLTIYEHLYGEPDAEKNYPVIPSYSYDAAPAETVEKTVNYESDTDFGQAVVGKNADKIWAVMDELMSVLKATVPRLYKATIRQIEESKK